MDAITLSDVTKRYRIGVGRARIREGLPAPADRVAARMFPEWWDKNRFKVLDDVSLTVPKGSAVGLVGHNGAGKTTMLKVIAGVTAPDTGSVQVEGKIAALIDALVGFHPELTGRENIFLLGSMHGCGRKEMAPRIEQVLKFAEITDMADTPLKRFSSGMAARLGFATMTALDVDVLLVDEVLAVGDAAFQRKCVRWLDDFREGGGTLLFVSHNLGLVRSMTQHAVWVDAGQVLAQGDTSKVLAEYGSAMEQRRSGDSTYSKKRATKSMVDDGMHRWGTGGVRVEEVHLEGPDEALTLKVHIRYGPSAIPDAHFAIGFVDESGQELGGATSPVEHLQPEGGDVVCTIAPVPLHTGIYFPVVAILGNDDVIHDRWRLDRAVVVDSPVEHGAFLGPVEVVGSWGASEAGT